MKQRANGKRPGTSSHRRTKNARAPGPASRRYSHAVDHRLGERWMWRSIAALFVLVVAMVTFRAASPAGVFGRPIGAVRGPLSMGLVAEARDAKGEPPRDRPADFALRGEPEMRVCILERAESVELRATRGLAVTVGGSERADALRAAGVQPGALAVAETLRGVEVGTVGAFGRPVEIRIEQGFFVLRELSGTSAPSRAAGEVIGRFPLAGGMVFSVAGETASEDDQDPVFMIQVNGKAYPGRMRILARPGASDRTFDVIEHVMMEQYLPGVVSKEMFARWPQGAYLAQAVVARTYALHERARSMSVGETFDVRAGQSDQAYDGNTINPQALAAVRETRGMALVFGGHVLRAYYSSTCGGRTSAACDTWPIGRGFEYNLARPIQEHPRASFCDDAPLYRWSVQRSRAELLQRLRAFGQSYGRSVRKLQGLSAIEVEEFNRDGRPKKYRVVEPGGTTHSLSAEEIRLACNTGAAGLPAIDRKNRVNSSDLEFEIQNHDVKINGRGYGHGVGLCQYCAKSMADHGMDWRSIVQSFYPGATAQRLY